MKSKSSNFPIINWSFWFIVFTLGLLNIAFVHPIPGFIYLILSFLFFPPTNTLLQKRFDFAIPFFIQVILGVIILWFTLGVSDLMQTFETWAL